MRGLETAATFSLPKASKSRCSELCVCVFCFVFGVGSVTLGRQNSFVARGGFRVYFLAWRKPSESWHDQERQGDRSRHAVVVFFSRATTYNVRSGTTRGTANPESTKNETRLLNQVPFTRSSRRTAIEPHVRGRIRQMILNRDLGLGHRGLRLPEFFCIWPSDAAQGLLEECNLLCMVCCFRFRGVWFGLVSAFSR